MQCALTSSAAAQRVQARRTPGRRPLTVQATAQPQTTTGMPKPKWAGAARRGDGQARRRQPTPLWPVAPGRLVRHLMVHPLRLHRSPATPLGSRRASGACASAAAASLVFRAAVPTIHAPSLMCASAGDDLLSRLVNVVINSPLFDLLREGARARIKVRPCRCCQGILPAHRQHITPQRCAAPAVPTCSSASSTRSAHFFPEHWTPLCGCRTLRRSGGCPGSSACLSWSTRR